MGLTLEQLGGWSYVLGRLAGGHDLTEPEASAALTDVFDGWKTGKKVSDKPHIASLNDVTLYTTLESCAQCSGVMSLAGVKQIVYLQNDFTAYMIGNIMYNLANRIPIKDSQGNVVSTLPGAPVPIPASRVGLDEFDALNNANLAFVKDLKAAETKKDSTKAFFISSDKALVDYDPSITSFLCTDTAYGMFERGGNKLDSEPLKFRNSRFPDKDKVLTNEQCLAEAREFFKYADIEGYRGSPHKL